MVVPELIKGLGAAASTAGLPFPKEGEGFEPSLKQLSFNTLTIAGLK
jgi:hypothetical protein